MSLKYEPSVCWTVVVSIRMRWMCMRMDEEEIFDEIRYEVDKTLSSSSPLLSSLELSDTQVYEP